MQSNDPNAASPPSSQLTTGEVTDDDVGSEVTVAVVVIGSGVAGNACNLEAADARTSTMAADETLVGVSVGVSGAISMGVCVVVSDGVCVGTSGASSESLRVGILVVVSASAPVFLAVGVSVNVFVGTARDVCVGICVGLSMGGCAKVFANCPMDAVSVVIDVSVDKQ